MRKGIMTITGDNRIADWIACKMLDMKLYKTDGYYPIFEDSTGKEVGRFWCIYGNWLIIRFLEVITDIRGKNLKKVKIDY